MYLPSVKSFFHFFGLEITRYTSRSSSILQTITTLKHFDCNYLIDVGANTGQFALSIHKAGFKGSILSFEPLPDAWITLSKRVALDKSWNLNPRCAVGDYNGTTIFNVSKNSVSSSVLDIAHNHIDAAPSSYFIDKIDVPIITLDSIDFPVNLSDTSIALKVDVQGFEMSVLKGAQSLLDNVSIIILELSFSYLYSEQTSWQDMIAFLSTKGFQIWSIQPGFTNNKTGQMLQADGIFVRSTI